MKGQYEKDPFDYQLFEKKNIDDPEKNNEHCESFNKYSMSLSPLEYARYRKFCENHLHKDVYTGAIGGTISINLTMTSIGVGKSCRCDICNQSGNITDYRQW